MDLWKQINYGALAALVFLVIMFVTLVLPLEGYEATIAFGFASVTAALLSLRE